jgi:isochorismate pyruvate lyase
MADQANGSHVRVMDDRLAKLRHQIDALDIELVALLAKRHDIVKQVLAHKKAANIPARIQSRIDVVIDNAADHAEAIGADPDLARAVWAAMVEWFCAHEEKELAKAAYLPAPAVLSASLVR